jgi:hypothetical protein
VNVTPLTSNQFDEDLVRSQDDEFNLRLIWKVRVIQKHGKPASVRVSQAYTDMTRRGNDVLSRPSRDW